jgi:hypothetical protein
LLVGKLAAAALCLLQVTSNAATLTDKNSSITLNLNSSAVGMTDWLVDGGDQVNQQSFWFRIGSGPQFDLSAITTTPYITTLGTKQLTALYSNAQFGVSISYTLTGGNAGTGTSKLSEGINFYNYSTTTSLDMHLFVYSDFVLGGAAYSGSQNVALTPNTAIQTVSGAGLSNNVAFPLPAASHYQASASPQIYNGLTTVNDFTLNDVANFGPGAGTWAFEWDKVLAPSTSLGTISITDSLQVPEPSTAVLGLLGLGLIRLARRKARH